ncbi:MAG: toll/interleukin-1 receptor domain-containing protein [Prevotella sp.]|nr:toll/interleukin-1 receptor domain-containing protein [Prevotella sp.]
MKSSIFKRKGREDSESTRQWDTLITKIMEGNVVPVIGPEFMVDSERGTNPHQILIDDLAEAYEVEGHPTSFSQLLFDKNFDAEDRKNIYVMLGDAFEQKLFEPSALLKRLLSIRQFPFVITTSFTPVVEDAMREIWGNELRVMKFSNDPARNDDIKTRQDIRKPTVYYMFGRVCHSEKKYVVTDTDMLAFCKSWLSSAERPQNLASELQSKYLLILGNSYSDWLCRFVWYSMKSRFEAQPVGMMVDPVADDNLLQFMRRIDAFTQNNMEEVLDKMESMIEARMKEEQSSGAPMKGADVFLSYSRSDSDVAKQLYNTLKARGMRVWFDRDSLSYGASFMDEIIAAIKSARLFVPIMTQNIEREKNDYHPYRTEWQTAIDMATGYGRNFIFPVSERSFDFYGSNVPPQLQRHNAFLYDPQQPSFEEFADQIANVLANL